MDFLEIDGAAGEGGGQVLRTSLSLSMATGRPFRIRRIRAGRERPGLLRQHLTAVQAIAEVCGAQVEGARLGSTELSVAPGRARHGEHRFAVGTAGAHTWTRKSEGGAAGLSVPPSTTMRLSPGARRSPAITVCSTSAALPAVPTAKRCSP